MVASGIVLIDKPQDWTSHDVVAKVRKAIGTKKVGHAGTLDPLATGLLVLGIESGTKLLTFLVGADKTYLATIRLGASTVSDDSQSEIIFSADSEIVSSISDDQIQQEVSKLQGVIQQRPSSVSAIKVDGKRAYDLVRAGQDVELKSREVKIHAFELLKITRVSESLIDLDVRVECSSGTYIRALARDLGDALSVGGHITALRRTKVGSFDVYHANRVDQLDQLKITSLAQAASEIFPTYPLTDAQVTDLVHGKKLQVEKVPSGLVAGVSGSGKLVAVLEANGSSLKSVVVFQGELND